MPDGRPVLRLTDDMGKDVPRWELRGGLIRGGVYPADSGRAQGTGPPTALRIPDLAQILRKAHRDPNRRDGPVPEFHSETYRLPIEAGAAHTVDTKTLCGVPQTRGKPLEHHPHEPKQVHHTTYRLALTTSSSV